MHTAVIRLAVVAIAGLVTVAALVALVALQSSCDFGYHVAPPIDGGTADAGAGEGEAAR